MRTRRLVSAAFAVLVLAAAYFLWPLLTLYQVARAAQAGDASTVLAHLDLAEIQSSLLHQALAGGVGDEAAEQLSALAGDLLGQDAEQALRQQAAELFPPDMVIRLLSKGELAVGAGGSGQTERVGQGLSGDPLSFVASYRVVQPIRVRLTLADPGRPDTSLGLTFRFVGTGWLVSEILLPPAALDRIRPLVEQFDKN